MMKCTCAPMVEGTNKDCVKHGLSDKAESLRQLPNIQELFDVFVKYGIECSRANYSESAFNDARVKFKLELIRLGIAHCFRWDE